MTKPQRPSIPTKFFGQEVRVTTDRKNRAYAIWYRHTPAIPGLFNDELKRLGNKLGATSFALAPMALKMLA